MTERDEERLWRDIVDNYGDRADIADPVAEKPLPPTLPPAVEPPPTTFVFLPPPPEPDRSDELPAWEGFVPPEAPPVSYPRGQRLLAWLGVVGAPAVLLVSLVLSIGLAPVLAYALVAWFVGGFLYLVLLMPRGPREPWDDGARL